MSCCKTASVRAFCAQVNSQVDRGILLRLLEIARQQKMRVNSGMSQRDLLESGIDILDTNAELYSEGKPLASQHNVDAQLYAAGLTFAPFCAVAAWIA